MIIHINDQGIVDEPMAPFGGVKNSGYGKFGGSPGLPLLARKTVADLTEAGITN